MQFVNKTSSLKLDGLTQFVHLEAAGLVSAVVHLSPSLMSHESGTGKNL